MCIKGSKRGNGMLELRLYVVRSRICFLSSSHILTFLNGNDFVRLYGNSAEVSCTHITSTKYPNPRHEYLLN